MKVPQTQFISGVGGHSSSQQRGARFQQGMAARHSWRHKRQLSWRPSWRGEGGVDGCLCVGRGGEGREGGTVNRFVPVCNISFSLCGFWNSLVLCSLMLVRVLQNPACNLHAPFVARRCCATLFHPRSLHFLSRCRERFVFTPHE